MESKRRERGERSRRRRNGGAVGILGGIVRMGGSGGKWGTAKEPSANNKINESPTTGPNPFIRILY